MDTSKRKPGWWVISRYLLGIQDSSGGEIRIGVRVTNEMHMRPSLKQQTQLQEKKEKRA